MPTLMRAIEMVFGASPSSVSFPQPGAGSPHDSPPRKNLLHGSSMNYLEAIDINADRRDG